MKKRNIAFVVIMSIITLGIYSLYWLVATRQELVKKGYQIPSIWIIFLPIPLVVLFAVLAANTSFQYPTAIGIWLIFLLVAIFLYLCVYWLIKYCRAVERVTNGNLSFNFSLGMAILLSLVGVWFVWNAIVQYHFNKIITAPTPPTPQPQGSVPHASASPPNPN